MVRFKLPGLFRINAKIGGEFHWATHTFGYVYKCAIGSDCRIECRKEVIIGRKPPFPGTVSPVRVVRDGIAKRAEDNTLLCQRFTVSGGDRYRVKDGVNRH